MRSVTRYAQFSAPRSQVGTGHDWDLQSTLMCLYNNVILTKFKYTYDNLFVFTSFHVLSSRNAGRAFENISTNDLTASERIKAFDRGELYSMQRSALSSVWYISEHLLHVLIPQTPLFSQKRRAQGYQRMQAVSRQLQGAQGAGLLEHRTCCTGLRRTFVAFKRPILFSPKRLTQD